MLEKRKYIGCGNESRRGCSLCPVGVYGDQSMLSHDSILTSDQGSTSIHTPMTKVYVTFLLIVQDNYFDKHKIKD